MPTPLDKWAEAASAHYKEQDVEHYVIAREYYRRGFMHARERARKFAIAGCKHAHPSKRTAFMLILVALQALGERNRI